MAPGHLSAISLILVILFYTPYTFAQSDDVENNDDKSEYFTDMQTVLTFAKRLDELEKWKIDQQLESIRMKSRILEQEEKINRLEGLLLITKAQNTETVPPETHLRNEVQQDSSSSSDERQRKLEAVNNNQVPNAGRIFARRGDMLDSRMQRKDKSRSRRQLDEANRVAFFATSSGHITNLGQSQILEFDNVTTNIGLAYSSHTGAFTAPFDGTYVISVSLMGQTRHNTHYYVAKNGAELSRLYIHGTESPFTTTSHTVVVQLRQGDDLEIRNSDAGEGVYGYKYSCFSGFLLYFDEPSGQNEIIG